MFTFEIFLICGHNNAFGTDRWFLHNGNNFLLKYCTYTADVGYCWFGKQSQQRLIVTQYEV